MNNKNNKTMKEYIVIFKKFEELKELENAVSLNMRSGWEPQGGICAFGTSRYLAQAMIRETTKAPAKKASKKTAKKRNVK